MDLKTAVRLGSFREFRMPLCSNERSVVVVKMRNLCCSVMAATLGTFTMAALDVDFGRRMASKRPCCRYHTFCVGLSAVPAGDWYCERWAEEAPGMQAKSYAVDAGARKIDLQGSKRRRANALTRYNLKRARMQEARLGTASRAF